MFCNKCGNQIPDDSTFCGKCGANLSALASQAENIEQSDKNQVQFAQPSKKKKGKKTAIIVSIAAVAVIGTIAAIMLPVINVKNEDIPVSLNEFESEKIYEVTEYNEKKETELTVENLDWTMDSYIGTYVGDVDENGVPDGKGTFRGTDIGGIEAEYNGEWKDGMLNGYGVLKEIYVSGDVKEWIYEGEWLNSKNHGKGTITHHYTNGDIAVWSAEFVDGQIDGQGTFTHTYTNDEDLKQILYAGEWSENKFNGQGKLTYIYIDGETTIWEGSFVNNNPHGQCEFTYIDSNGNEEYIKGEWVNGERVEEIAAETLTFDEQLELLRWGMSLDKIKSIVTTPEDSISEKEEDYGTKTQLLFKDTVLWGLDAELTINLTNNSLDGLNYRIKTNDKKGLFEDLEEFLKENGGTMSDSYNNMEYWDFDGENYQIFLNNYTYDGYDYVQISFWPIA